MRPAKQVTLHWLGRESSNEVPLFEIRAPKTTAALHAICSRRLTCRCNENEVLQAPLLCRV